MRLSSQICDQCEDFLVLNKPPGLAMHSESGPGLIAKLRAELGRKALYPVHRLDAETSGLLLIAKNTDANRELSLMFQNKQVEKIYLALLSKKPLKSQGCVAGDMLKARGGSWRLAKTKVKPAHTWFFSYGYAPGKRLAILKPLTGKTHQLRVAMKALAAPILGDQRYGSARHARMCLHAWQLRFRWRGRLLQYVAPFSGVFDEANETPSEFESEQLPKALEALGSPFDLPWPKAACIRFV